MAASIFGDAFREVAYGAVPGGNVLVVLSLRGGADGLSMVVPRGPDHARLAEYRPGIVVPAASLIGGDTRFGLHPAFAPLLPMWQAGTFGAVHAIGLPTPNRSHFDAMEAVEDADAGSSLRRGWINRMVGLDSLALPETAVQLGSSLLPTSLVGAAPALGVYQVSDLQIADLGTGAVKRKDSLRGMWGIDRTGMGDMVRSTLGGNHPAGFARHDRDPDDGLPQRPAQGCAGQHRRADQGRRRAPRSSRSTTATGTCTVAWVATIRPWAGCTTRSPTSPAP